MDTNFDSDNVKAPQDRVQHQSLYTREQLEALKEKQLQIAQLKFKTKYTSEGMKFDRPPSKKLLRKLMMAGKLS